MTGSILYGVKVTLLVALLAGSATALADPPLPGLLLSTVRAPEQSLQQSSSFDAVSFDAATDISSEHPNDPARERPSSLSGGMNRFYMKLLMVVTANPQATK